MGWGLTIFVILLQCVYHAQAYPVPEDGSWREGEWSGREYILTALGVAALLSTVTTLLACVCCRRSGFKELGSVSSRVAGSSSTINHGGPREEFTMFPPPGISNLSYSTANINFEPLPDIRPRSASRREQQITDKTLPASFPTRVSAGLPTDEWFAEPHQNFPRNQLQYVKEIGKGWFGHVLEGRATGIFSDHTKGDSPVTTSLTPSATSSRGQTPVAVKVLREDATPTEQMYFLHELRPYRDLSHPNVLKVLAQCLETEPFLILLQLCPKGDLKAVVRNDKKLTDAVLLRMTLDVAAGLTHMHANDFIHTDLAARNCVVDEDYTVKIGDYGYNIDFYKTEYYCAGEVALPLRWCSPETLKCTDTTIETKEVTKAANVWSFGVIMWEIASRGELPYTNLDDDRVIQEVVVEQSCILETPKALQLHAAKVYNIMKLCWSEEPSRPPMDHLTSLLTHLWENHSVTSHDASTSDFELRWNQLQQRQPQDHSIMHGVNTSDLRFESDFSLSVTGGNHMGGALSPSLQNLHGSVEDLDAKMAAKFGSALPSWLGMEPGQPMDSLTREITDAILKLDDYLAGEKSEPSTTQASPDKDGINFKLGKDSFVSHPPESKLVHSMSGSGHSSITMMLSEGDDEGFTMRLEQGEFSEMVRLKSQSVQDFMKLTVVDDGSDSDNASQRNSLAFEPVNNPLAPEKSYSSEGNIREALRDDTFMVEIERLQAEHKYSIITEASRENPSSMEYRSQDFNFEKTDNYSDMLADSEAGSTDQLATSVDSDHSNIFSDKQTSEQDPFLGEVFSSEITEETNISAFPIPKNNREICDSEHNSSVNKPLSSSPDFVVSSREPKPAALPDIVVHDASVKLSTPSPPPVESPVKVINADQPKEFRLVFSEKSDTSSYDNRKIQTAIQSKGDSVIFSENLHGTKFGESEVEIHSRCETEDCTENKNNVDSSVYGVLGEESSIKGGEITKYLEFVHENPKQKLSSTPLKKNNEESYKNIKNDDVDGGDSLNASEKSSVHDASYDEDGEFCSEIVLAVDPDSLGMKQRLVFGYQSETRLEESESGEEEQEENSDLEREELDNVPSYMPEQIVEGEDVVIGALDDYSLDLYKAVKSTSAPIPDKEDKCNLLVSSDEGGRNRVNNHINDIEFDLQQWDEFLGNKLSEERNDVDVVFKEGSIDNFNFKSDKSGDILGATFDVPDNMKTSVADGDLPINKTEKSLVDLSSTFEHSTCDEIQEVMVREENDEIVPSVSRPPVNTDMFFSSDPSKVSLNSVEVAPKETFVKEVSSDLSMLKRSPIHEESSKSTDTSYVTAISLASESQISTEVSELFKTLSNASDALVETGSEETSEREESKSAQVIERMSLHDVTSDSFTYKRELSVDGSFNVVNASDVSNISPLKVNKEINIREEDCASEVDFNITSELDPLACNERSKEGLDEVDAQPKTKTLSEISDVVDGDLKSTNVSAQILCNNSNVDETSNMLNLENSKSVPSTKSTQLMLDPFTVDLQSNLIIKDDDDLSPSAYQGKLKSEDCWSSQESQDSAVENDEAENGEFWQQQMMAWQQAAFQTRQLLQQAAGSGSDATLASLKGSQEDLEASPRSDSSSTKSPYSSSDMLNLDDEGTYVSYNTTDDEEVLGYKPEDISALRAELNLKLGGLQDERDQIEPEEPDESSLADRENVVINYRGIVTTLSPIKEESFLDEDESPVRKMSKKNESSDFSNLQHIEFEEESMNFIENGNDTFVVNEAVNDAVVNEKVVGLSEFAFAEDLENLLGSDEGAADNISESTFLIGREVSSTSEVPTDKQEHLSPESARNSLILEDLDNEDGPSSIQIYNSGDNLDADDLLVVDTTTNQASIVEGGIPRSHLAFITDEEEQPEPTDVVPFSYDESDDVAPESIPSVGGTRYDEMRHREQFLANNPSWENSRFSQAQEYEGDSESKPEGGHVSSLVTSEENLQSLKDEHGSPQGIQVPHYHSYFTSALSTLSHPGASLEEPPIFEQVEHVSLPYDVNYPAAGEQAQSLESLSESDEPVESKETEKKQNETKEANEEEADEEEVADALIKLNFLGRLYSDDSEEKAEESPSRSHNVGEATLLSDSDEEMEHRSLNASCDGKDFNQMTSAEFLASEKYQIQDNDDIEEQIEVQAGYEDDSEDDDAVPPTPGKLGQVNFRMMQEPRYTPDWESDSDSDGDSSSTSGEFMWRQEEEEEKEESIMSKPEPEKPGEDSHQGSYILDVIEEEGEDDGAREGDVDDDGCSEDSESGEEEFTPSQWNRNLTPSHSLLKSPQNRSSLKKSVRWKRQRHHRVYEYPPEPRSWEPTPTESHRRSWGRSSLDYLSLADWELGADEFIADDGGDMDDYVYRKPMRPAPPPPIYSLGSMSFDDDTGGYMVENDEFFIRSSGSPFTYTSSSFSASDFFSGSPYFSGSDQNLALPDPITDELTNNLTDHLMPNTVQSDSTDLIHSQINKYVVGGDDSEHSSPTNSGLGQLRHTRDKLRLEIPTISVASDVTKGAAFNVASEKTEFENYNGQDVSASVSVKRTEPEVSEV